MKIYEFLKKNPIESEDSNQGRPIQIESYLIDMFTIRGPTYFFLEFDSRLKAYFALIQHRDLYDPWKIMS